MENIDFLNKIVVLRTDYNVPVSYGEITSTLRIDASLRTINHILSGKPKRLIIISHMGRPKDKEYQLSLKPVKDYLEEKLRQDIHFISVMDYIHIDPNCIKEKVVLFENIRFYKEETNDIPTTPVFREYLSSIGDVYINDAFGCSHRAHSSIVGIKAPERCNGFLVEREKTFLKDIFKNRGKFTLILGGSKISDKIQLINNLIPKVNNILIGGGMAFTFLKYFGTKIGNSLFDEEGFKLVPGILENALKNKTNIIMPIDFTCNDKFENGGNIVYKEHGTGIPENFMGLDIGNKTIHEFKLVLTESDYIIWNGPLGVFELDDYAFGSEQIMKHIAKLPATTIIGGGDTAACCEKFKLSDQMNHISTGGGASLELLEGKNLPGLF